MALESNSESPFEDRERSQPIPRNAEINRSSQQAEHDNGRGHDIHEVHEEEPVEVGGVIECLVDGMPWRQSYLIKSLYFLEALSSATWGRFGVLYYHFHGFDSREIGLVEFVLTIIPIFSTPVWGYLSDVYNCRKTIYVTTKASSTIILLSLALPSVYQHKQWIWMVTIVTKLFSGGGLLDSYTLELLGTKNKLLYGRYRLYSSLSWGLGALVMGWSTDHYGFEPNFIYYGVLGFLCLLLVIYHIPGDKDSASNGSRPSPSPATTDRSDSIASEESRVLQHTQQQRPQSQDRLRSSRILLKVFLRPRVILFLVQVIVMGAAMATSERLLFLYMVNDLQSSTMLCGMSVAVNVIFELPLFWYATNIHRWFGLDGLQWIAMLCFAARAYGYTLLEPSTRLWILPLESLHGVTFGCFWIVLADVSKALIQQVEILQNREANDINEDIMNTSSTTNNVTSHHNAEQRRPLLNHYDEDGSTHRADLDNEDRDSNSTPTKNASWSTTIPSMVQMLYSAVGVGLGSVIGGWAMQYYGSKYMYRCMAIVMLGTWVCHSIGCILVRCGSRTDRRLEENTVDTLIRPDHANRNESNGRDQPRSQHCLLPCCEEVENFSDNTSDN